MLCFAAQNLRYSVKNDVGLVVIDCPGKASGQDNTVISRFLYVLICYTIATSEKKCTTSMSYQFLIMTSVYGTHTLCSGTSGCHGTA